METLTEHPEVARHHEVLRDYMQNLTPSLQHEIIKVIMRQKIVRNIVDTYKNWSSASRVRARTNRQTKHLKITIRKYLVIPNDFNVVYHCYVPKNPEYVLDRARGEEMRMDANADALERSEKYTTSFTTTHANVLPWALI